MKKYLPSFPGCFACGKENSRGIKLSIFEEDGIIQAEFKPISNLAGYPGIVHGGISCTVLDEIMWWAAFGHSGKSVVTGEITVKLVKPLLQDGYYTVSAEIIEDKKRYLLVQGTLKGGDEVYCKASGKYFLLSPGEDEQFKSGFKYQYPDGKLIPPEFRYPT